MHLRDRDGSNERQVALPAGVPALYSQAWPTFSPNGKWIAMESWVGQPGTGARQIAVASVDGSSPTRRIGPLAPEHAMVKMWSPDGTRILAHVDTIDDIYLIDPVSGEAQLLPWKSDFPNWQRVAPLRRDQRRSHANDAPGPTSNGPGASDSGLAGPRHTSAARTCTRR